jgi:dolichyl-phosphate-mannose-protein mannosyltransferase
MTTPPDRRGPRIVLGLAAGLFLLEWIPSLFGPYGYFIDEFYYLACAARPAWGYVDHPPFSILILDASRWLLGDSLPALRLVPALCGAGTVILTGALARRLGAGIFGQTLASVATVFAPIPLVLFGIYSMNSIEMLLWIASFYVLAVLLAKDQPRLWLIFGLLTGIGLLNKHTAVLLSAAVTIGMLLSPARKQLATRWPWLGAGLATLIVLPNLWWQHAHGWPSLEFYRNADLYKNAPTPPLQVLIQQILFYNPGAFPVWLAGLLFFLRSERGRPYRAIGWAGASLLIMMIVSQKSRPDRIAALYPMLFAGGAVWLEAISHKHRLGWTRPASLLLIVSGGLVFLPLAVPLLPPQMAARYAAATGVVPQIERGEGKASQLPQWFADRFGWREFVADVETAVRRLTPEERSRAVIVVPSYGHAGALELFGGPDLPPVLSPQNTYYLWGLELLAGRNVEGGIAVGSDPGKLRQFYTQVELIGVHRCSYCMPWRANLAIYRVWGPKAPLVDVWPQLRHYE